MSDDLYLAFITLRTYEWRSFLHRKKSSITGYENIRYWTDPPVKDRPTVPAAPPLLLLGTYTYYGGRFLLGHWLPDLGGVASLSAVVDSRESTDVSGGGGSVPWITTYYFFCWFEIRVRPTLDTRRSPTASILLIVKNQWEKYCSRLPRVLFAAKNKLCSSFQ